MLAMGADWEGRIDGKTRVTEGPMAENHVPSAL
jgi:hypothetical protein